MPRGSPAKPWPLVPLIAVEGRKRTPLDVLREIIDRAERGAPNAGGLKDLALNCIANAHERRIADGDHAEFVRQALEAARQGRWELAGQLLQHEQNTRREKDPMPWPSYDIPVPASLILNEIVFRASVANPPPPNLSGIINAAIRCASNVHANPQVGPHTEAQQGNPGTPALDHRLVNALSRAVVATTPADWVYVENELDHD